MELLRELSRLQHERGYLDNETLQELSQLRRVPLYVLEGLVSFYPAFRRTSSPQVAVRVCRDICCLMAGGDRLGQQLAERLAHRDDVEVCGVSCLGRCDAAPAARANDIPLPPPGLADLDQALRFIDDPTDAAGDTPGGPVRDWRCDPYEDAAEHYGTVRSLIAAGSDIGSICIQRLQDSRLCGMGGAAFPTGRKWELVAQEASEPDGSAQHCLEAGDVRAAWPGKHGIGASSKYVICNADESEPGTFKDRVIMEELPHLVIEGMLLAALTVGAEQGIIYLRHEYGRQQRALESAIAAARRLGVLGPDAAGSGRRFDIELFVSPGGYILGEETALLEALEDKRGEPRNKPPYPVTCGLWGRPTLINNVETFALATSIVHHGSDWWHAQGKGAFSGLKFCSISGDITRPEVYEVPRGTTLAELIELAGGVPGGKRLKAFLPGGASSNFLTAGHIDTPLDFQAMQQAGSMLGTASVIVIAEGRDLFALATNLVEFFRNESCGKCVPCREGSERAVQLLQQVHLGDRPAAQLEVLADLGETLEQTSICGLGQVALNPILSMMKHFPDEVPK